MFWLKYLKEKRLQLVLIAVGTWFAFITWRALDFWVKAFTLPTEGKKDDQNYV